VSPLYRPRSENTAGASTPSDIYSTCSAINVAAPVHPTFGVKILYTVVTMLIAGYEESTSGLEPPSCSLRVIIQALQGLAQGCRRRISKEFILLCLPPFLRSWSFQSGVNSIYVSA
jgi:hypothetical protein